MVMGGLVNERELNHAHCLALIVVRAQFGHPAATQRRSDVPYGGFLPCSRGEHTADLGSTHVIWKGSFFGLFR